MNDQFENLCRFWKSHHFHQVLASSVCPSFRPEKPKEKIPKTSRDQVVKRCVEVLWLPSGKPKHIAIAGKSWSFLLNTIQNQVDDGGCSMARDSFTARGGTTCCTNKIHSTEPGERWISTKPMVFFVVLSSRLPTMATWNASWAISATTKRWRERWGWKI